MRIAVPRESSPDETRVALVPSSIPRLAKAGFQVQVQSGAGTAAGFADESYRQRGAQIVDQRADLFAADIVVQVRSAGASHDRGAQELPLLRPSSTLIGLADPLGCPQAVKDVADRGATFFALEMIPRITRAQSMDVLSSMATIAGYHAVLMAAVELPKMFPLMMTAAGTVAAARVFVVGAGVAGLQAIATARRLGGVVQAYDVRPACREQVESLGAKFVEMELESTQAEDQGGYARAMDEVFYSQQRDLMASVVRDSDVVVTTAAVPGRPAPLLITEQAVMGMAPGSVIVDLAAERGGNCQPSQPDQRVVTEDVVVLGPTNLPACVPHHASQMFSNNVTQFLLNLVVDNQVQLDRDDQIVRDTMVARDGQVTNTTLRELLDLPPPEQEDEQAATASSGPEEESA